MVRQAIMISIMTVILLLGIFEIYYLKKSTTEITQLLHTSIEYINLNEPEKAIDQCNKTYDQWQSYKKTLSFYIKNETLNKVDMYIKSLSPLIETQTFNDFYLQVNQLIYIISDIYESEILTIENIF